MRRVLILAIVLLVALSSAAMAREWIGTLSLQGSGWTTVSGAGYGGSDAYTGTGMSGERRGVWSFNFSDMPTEAFKANIYVYSPVGAAHGWQPIEVTFNGAAGDAYPMEANNPWVGQYGTNHQYLGCDWNVEGTWMKAGPGPQSPDMSDWVWVKQGSQLYTKWDFGWSITNTIDGVKLVEVVPEPASLVALLAGLPALAIFRRKR